MRKMNLISVPVLVLLLNSLAWGESPNVATGDIGVMAADSMFAKAVSLDNGIRQENKSADKPGFVAKKSLKKAFFLSLLIPGAGEYYAGAKSQAKVFLGTEALIWSFAGISKFRGEMWKRDYRNYAAQHAGANPDRTEDIYYQNVYEYSSSYWYNEDIWAEARMIYPDDPAAQETYVSGLLYGPADSWTWTSRDDWYSYRELRVKSQESLHRISYSFGAALVNRLLSSVNAARLAKRYNKNRFNKAEARQGWDMGFFADKDCELGIVFNKSF